MKHLAQSFAPALFAPVVAWAAPRTNHWVSLTGGNWSDTTKWADTSFYPDGTNDVAFVDSKPPNGDDTTSPSGDTIITLDVPVTLGELHIRCRGFRFNRAGQNRLTMARDDGREALIRVFEPIAVRRTLQFDTPVHFASDARVASDEGTIQFNSSALLSSEDDGVTLTATVGVANMTLTFGDMSLFTGAMVLERFTANGNINLPSTDARFNAGPVFIKSSANAAVPIPINDARAAQFTVEQGAEIQMISNDASFAPCADASLLDRFLDSTKINFGNANTSVAVDRWPDSFPLPLDGTRIQFSGRPALNNCETVAAITYEKGAIIQLQGLHEDYENALSATSLSRNGHGTMQLFSDSTTWPVGTPQCRFTLADPQVGKFHPSAVVTKRSSSGTSANYTMPFLAGYDSARDSVIALPHDLTNAFGNATQSVLFTNKVDLLGGSFDCFTLAAGETGPDGESLFNGTVRIHSGFFASMGAYRRFTMNLFFGADGAGEALIYVVGGTGDTRRNDNLTGHLHCVDLTKFGTGVARLSGNNTNLFGIIRINQGALAVDAAQGVQNTNDVWVGCGNRFIPAAAQVNIGGLSSDLGAILENGFPVSVGPACLLAVTPAVGEEHVFKGSFRNGNNITSVFTMEIREGGTQGFSGSLSGANLVLAENARMKLAGKVSADSLQCADASTLVVTEGASLAVSGAAELPGTVVLEGAFAEGERALILAAGGVSGGKPALDTNGAKFPDGMYPKLLVKDGALLLSVAPPRGTLLFLK